MSSNLYKHKYHKYKTKYVIQNLQNDLNKLHVATSLQKEMLDWITLFRILKSKYPDIKIYLKGGSILGFQVMRFINDPTITNFIMFYDLNLIRDWDFMIYYKADPEIDTSKSKCNQGLYAEIINTITKYHKFRTEGFTTCVIRHRDKTMINNDEVLLEASIDIKNKMNNYSAIEVPLTAMDSELTNNLIFDFFRIVGIFRLLEELDITNNPIYKQISNQKSLNQKLEDEFVSSYKEYDLRQLITNIYKFVNTLTIITVTAQDGYIKLSNSNELDYGNMKEHKQIFDNFDCSLNQRQFLLSQYNNTLRLVRLFDKNIPKSNKIKKYLIALKINKLPPWLLNDKEIITLLDKFSDHLYTSLFKTYVDKLEPDYNKTDVINLFIALDNFFSKTGIVAIYCKLQKLKNNKETYSHLKEIIQEVFKKFIPKLPLSNYTKEFDRELEKIKLKPNFTYKLFSVISKETN